MNKGFISREGELHCASCQTKVSKDGALRYHFCPNCGNPLDMNSMVSAEKQTSHEVLVVLYDIINLLDEGKDAKKVINQFINDFKK